RSAGCCTMRRPRTTTGPGGRKHTSTTFHGEQDGTGRRRRTLIATRRVEEDRPPRPASGYRRANCSVSASGSLVRRRSLFTSPRISTTPQLRHIVVLV